MGSWRLGESTSKNQSKICNKATQDDRVFQSLLIYLRFCSVSHFYEINVKIYCDQFSETAAPFRYVKKRRPITNMLSVVTGGIEIGKKLPA